MLYFKLFKIISCAVITVFCRITRNIYTNNWKVIKWISCSSIKHMSAQFLLRRTTCIANFIILYFFFWPHSILKFTTWDEILEILMNNGFFYFNIFFCLVLFMLLFFCSFRYQRIKYGLKNQTVAKPCAACTLFFQISLKEQQKKKKKRNYQESQK